MPSPASDFPSSHDFMIEAAIEGGATIHRRLGMGGKREPDEWAGRPIRFHHRTLDPDDLDDVYFDYEDRKASLDLRG